MKPIMMAAAIVAGIAAKRRMPRRCPRQSRMTSDFRSKASLDSTISSPARSPPNACPAPWSRSPATASSCSTRPTASSIRPRARAMPLDAVFALASMTKPMAAVAGLTLMEQGRLPLKAKLSDYYPAFADMKVGVPQADGSLKLDAQASPIYIHDLYRHTSGLMYGGRPDSSSPVARQYPDGTAPAIEGDTQAFIDRITKLPLAHQPCDGFRVRLFDRCARRRRRKGERAAARRIPCRQCVAAARHDRRHVPSRRRRSARVWPGRFPTIR